MSIVHFRPDYAKFLIQAEPDRFASLYHALNAVVHTRQFAGDWLASHKVRCLRPFGGEDYLYSIDIWGEWAGIVSQLPFLPWASWLKRFDVRGVVWDASGEAVLGLGHRIQSSDVGYNVEVFNSRPASKRLGRDRGGQGFRIGSRKSDICLVIYKRTGEATAQEARFQGPALRDAVERVLNKLWIQGEVVDRWEALVGICASKGQQRLRYVLDKAGIGAYWPTYRHEAVDPLPPRQASFTVFVPSEEDLREAAEWAQSLEELPQEPAPDAE